MDAYDYLLKFLLIGNPATGKTCILRWFLDEKFKEDTLHTIGVEFGTKIVHIEGKAVKLQIWDTAGQERFQCVTRSYYRGAAGALVVYDINDRGSYNAVTQWIESVRELALPNLVILLVGNKLDLAEDSREVSESEAKQYAEDNGLYSFMETSAKTGRNVHEAFIAATRGILARDVLPKIGDMRSLALNPTQLIGQTQSPSSRRCCRS